MICNFLVIMKIDVTRKLTSYENIYTVIMWNNWQAEKICSRQIEPQRPKFSTWEVGFTTRTRNKYIFAKKWYIPNEFSILQPTLLAIHQIIKNNVFNQYWNHTLHYASTEKSYTVIIKSLKLYGRSVNSGRLLTPTHRHIRTTFYAITIIQSTSFANSFAKRSAEQPPQIGPGIFYALFAYID